MTERAYVRSRLSYAEILVPYASKTNSLLMRLVPDEGDNHAVQVEEEHDKVKSELDE